MSAFSVFVSEGVRITMSQECMTANISAREVEPATTPKLLGRLGSDILEVIISFWQQEMAGGAN